MLQKTRKELTTTKTNPPFFGSEKIEKVFNQKVIEGGSFETVFVLFFFIGGKGDGKLDDVLGGSFFFVYREDMVEEGSEYGTKLFGVLFLKVVESSDLFRVGSCRSLAVVKGFD